MLDSSLRRVYKRHNMKQRFQVTLHSTVVAMANNLMASRGFDSLSDFLESLIRAEDDRRNNINFARSFPVPTGETTAQTGEQNRPVSRPIEAGAGTQKDSLMTALHDHVRARKQRNRESKTVPAGVPPASIPAQSVPAIPKKK